MDRIDLDSDVCNYDSKIKDDDIFSNQIHVCIHFLFLVSFFFYPFSMVHIINSLKPFWLYYTIR